MDWGVEFLSCKAGHSQEQFGVEIVLEVVCGSLEQQDLATLGFPGAEEGGAVGLPFHLSSEKLEGTRLHPQQVAQKFH